jgi:hypothetical protein
MSFIFFIWFGCALLCGIVAAKKNRSVPGWLVVGCIFSLLALTVVICSPPLEEERPGSPSSQATHPCPNCHELVTWDERLCRHCGFNLAPQPEDLRTFWGSYFK